MERSQQADGLKAVRHILSSVPVVAFPTRILQGMASNATGLLSADMAIPDGYSLARFASSSNLSGNGIMFGGNELRAGIPATVPGVYDGGYLVRQRDKLSIFFYDYPKTVEAYSHNASPRTFTVELFS